MKLRIFEKNTIDETEVVVNCKQKNHEIKKLAKHILLYDGSIRCRKDDREYNIKINDIFYIETVDKNCFAATESEVYELRKSLLKIEADLKNTSFTRISKSMLLNINVLKSVAPLSNHRMDGELINGEHVVISRNYISSIKDKIRGM